MKSKDERLLVAIAQLCIVLDLLITLSAWHLEANPIVIKLGMLNFTITKVLLIISIEEIMFTFNGNKSRISWIMVWFIIVFHLIIVISNLWVVL